MKQTSQVLANFDLKARKSLGQNFLLNEKVLQQIVELANITPDDSVLEIGPGPGNLTKYLVQKAKKVLAIEIDRELAAILKAEIKNPNLTIIPADILGYNLNEIKKMGDLFKVISNLPYNISTQVVFKLLETRGLFRELYLLLQKEVAERIVARPRTKDYGILSVVCQLLSDPEIVLILGPEAFKPRPKVDSALVKFRVLPEPRFKLADYQGFKNLVHAGFAMRRKMLKNALARAGLGLSPEKVDDLLAKAVINPKSRAEELSVEQFASLANFYAGNKSKNA